MGDHKGHGLRRIGRWAAILALALLIVVSDNIAGGSIASATQCGPSGHQNRKGVCVYDNKKPPKKNPGKSKQPKVGDTWTETGYGGVCGNNTDPDHADFDCMNTQSCIPRNQGYIKYSVWTRVNTYVGGGEWKHGPWKSADREVCRKDDTGKVTEAQVIHEIERFGLRPARLEIEPPHGKTLVNFRTIFYSSAKPYQFHLTLGPGVDIKAEPVEFHWKFGDGHSTTSNGPGRPYPNFDVSHMYDRTGTFQPSVDVRYRVQWDAGDGWKTIDVLMDGKPGPAVELTVVSSRSELGN